MDGLLLALRVVLIFVLTLAGVAKLADRAGTRAALSGFGVRKRAARALSLLLPLAELAAAALLVPSASARVGAGLGLALLVCFMGAIARSDARGESPDCHCFGQLHSAPAGPKTLVRNLVLAAAAGLVLAAGPGASGVAWLGRLSAAGLTAMILGAVLAFVVALSSALVLWLLKRNGELLLAIDALENGDVQPVESGPGLPPGTPAPEFALPGLSGGELTLSGLRASGQPVLLTFTDPACGPCTALLPQLAGWQRQHRDQLRIAVLSRGAVEANLEHARRHGLTDVLLQRDREIDERFQVQGTPSAVLVAADGTIASHVHAGAEEIGELVATTTVPTLQVHHAEPPAPDIGDPAPDPRLRTLEGDEVLLSSRLAGRAHLLLFWNPACGFCERMLAQLRSLDAAPPADGPALLLISAGDAAGNRALGLQAPILLDDSFAAGNAFGAPGTPSAVLIDAGRIASAVAVGADAVLELAGASEPAALAA